MSIVTNFQAKLNRIFKQEGLSEQHWVGELAESFGFYCVNSEVVDIIYTHFGLVPYGLIYDKYNTNASIPNKFLFYYKHNSVDDFINQCLHGKGFTAKIEVQKDSNLFLVYTRDLAVVEFLYEYFGLVVSRANLSKALNSYVLACVGL